ncbi:hypothetical protein FZW89_00965 [Listeria monocytogenes]|nr:hypothetical protein [Listeria monocytogenes]EAE7067067.1 hypothetical protein [Listeria monocytogenes]EAG1402502.1 hypothetical protein [Listeria monocytogenes]EAV9863932.1 hypothetical protein [Listeria monocytogenes]EBF5144625.1 hypothetical protein [Listeria monocytogenes]
MNHVWQFCQHAIFSYLEVNVNELLHIKNGYLEYSRFFICYFSHSTFCLQNKELLIELLMK